MYKVVLATMLVNAFSLLPTSMLHAEDVGDVGALIRRVEDSMTRLSEARALRRLEAVRTRLQTAQQIRQVDDAAARLEQVQQKREKLAPQLDTKTQLKRLLVAAYAGTDGVLLPQELDAAFDDLTEIEKELREAAKTKHALTR